MKKRIVFLIPVLILVGGFAAMMILISMRSDVPRRTPEPRPKFVEVMVAHPERKVATVSGLGRVTSAQPVDLYSEVVGTLMPGDIPFQPAQSFKKGDLILKIDDRQIRLDINSAKSDFLSALGNVLAEIKSDYPNEYQIWRDYFDACDFEHSMAPLPESDNQRIRLLLSRFNVYKLYYSVKDMEITLEKHYFYAPFDGSIVSADLRVGSTARSGSHLGQIVNLENLEVELPVTVNEVKWLKRGTPVTLTSSSSKGIWKGTVSRIGSVIDQRTQTIPVYISVRQTSDAPLYDGVYLTAAIPGIEIYPAVTLPRHAIYSDSLVYLIENGVLAERKVSVARKEKETIIIDDGLNEGDSVVVDLMQGVVPGMPAMPRGAASMERGK
ncbi:MAG: efflux RND transporter periplasmic adaptor subunit [Candidatus Zixiibacteriota bacterium]